MPGVKGRSGKVPKPIAIHKIEGTYDKRFHGPYDHPIDDVSGTPRPPCDLPEDALLVFHHICETYAGMEGVLAEVDTYQLEMCCRWFSKARSLAKRMMEEELDDLSAARLERRAKNAWEVFDKAARQFGLTPTARAALRSIGSPGHSGTRDPLAEFGIA